jgi:GDP-mannose 6-dehydrogenase
MKITVFGLGYVGCVTLACLARNGHDVVGVDVNPDKVDLIKAGRPTIIEKDVDRVLAEAHSSGRVSATTAATEALVDSHISIICVGTPNSSSGHLSLEAIRGVARDIGRNLHRAAPQHVVLIRSTVPPGTNSDVARILAQESSEGNTRGAEVVSNPEFLRESSAVADFYAPPTTVLGTDSDAAFEKACRVYAGIDAPIRRTSVGVAEMIKLVNNSWHALKVSFANEVGVIAKNLGVDSHELMDLFCQDEKLNLSASYLRPGFAYGGSCLPKDLKALTTLSHDHYLTTPVLDSIRRSNGAHVDRLVQLIESGPERSLGILGLSFKAGTDDLRNSPLVDVAQTLLGRGYRIKIYDRNVHLSRLVGQNRSYVEEHLPHLGQLMTEDLDDVINSCAVLILANPEPEFREIADQCADKRVIDLVRIWPRDAESNPGYEGIAW